MRTIVFPTLLSLFLSACTVSGQDGPAGPIQLHPENPHYFLYDGNPTVLVTSAEHYGAVINRDFDYETYLNTLATDGLNYTRIFVGTYAEVPGAFNITNNTLAPATGKFLPPWTRTDQPGVLAGEPKVDLDRWNPEYFQRLKDFMDLASRHGIIVEVTFASSTYQDSNWSRSPFHPGNNINGFPEDLDRKRSNTVNNGPILEYQKKLVRKIVTELNDFDNCTYEIQNEPWSDNKVQATRILKTLDPKPQSGDWYKWADTASEASLKWQRVIAQTIVDTEASLPKKHLIAQNYANFKTCVMDIDPNISIMNFHYAWPDAVRMNYAWNRPICFDESGFAGSEDETYLTQAWEFMLAGGAAFNNLDYSFYLGHEAGDGAIDAPGGGSATLRKQLSYLKSYLESFAFVRMKHDHAVVHLAPGFEAQALSEPGEQYAIFLNGLGSDSIQLGLPAGTYRVAFHSPTTGTELAASELVVGSEPGISTIAVPGMPESETTVVLSLRRD